MATAALTFGSIGDVIALCNAIQTGIEALSSARGSTTKYQSLGREVWNLSRALVSVESLLKENANLERRGDLVKVVADCHDCFVRFLKRLESYECLAQSGEQQHSVKDIERFLMKLAWPASQVLTV